MAESTALIVLRELESSSSALLRAVQDALPFCLKVTSARRRAGGFTVERIYAVLGDEAIAIVDPWLAEVRALSRAAATLQRHMKALAEKTAELAADPNKLTDVSNLRSEFDGVTELHLAFSKAFASYDSAEKAVTDRINAVLDTQSDTAGWQDFLDISESIDALHAALVDRRARAAVRSQLQAALRQIDRTQRNRCLMTNLLS